MEREMETAIMALGALGMERKMETTIMGFIGTVTTMKIHSFNSQLTKGQNLSRAGL